MRRFILLRVEDVSGSSGTGVVARGVVNDNGWTVVFFADSFKFFPTKEKMMEIHAHGSRTRFHWQDDERGEPVPMPDHLRQRIQPG
ncbi:hypothetical protein N9917_04970 [Deltaproteobacteria bacterium]|nr:hypothetical protein [Deltaproteobacteria bacterium]